MKLLKKQKPLKIAVIGNHLPRQCGIATFTTDLCDALSIEIENSNNLITVAMDDISEGYDYPDRVKFRIRTNVLADYFHAADFLNANSYEVTILQHEYGIFGGKSGSHIINLIKGLQMPVLTNLHTVLKNPSDEQKLIIHELANYSERLLVMSKRAIELLESAYGISKDKVILIPHGIPNVEFKQPGIYNERLGIKESDVILTFGLLSPAKGLEIMIKAMPKIVKEHSNVLYIILGETHPHVKEAHGDAYRHGLQQLINQLGMEDHIVFHNYFVSLNALTQYLQTTTVYATPYINKEQITSGTLAYAVGCGTAVVSTPFWYAEELLANNRGKLVRFNDSDHMAEVIIGLLSDKKELNSIRKSAYEMGRSMTWDKVAKKHLTVINDVISNGKTRPKTMLTKIQNYRIIDKLPVINLSHMKILTDDTGILQHAKYTIPDYNHGYCVDDNARALIIACRYYTLQKDKSVIPLIQKYMSFLYYAFNFDNGKFRNFMSYDRKWLENTGSEDSHGRAIWGLGVAIQHVPSDGLRNMALRLFLEALPRIESFISPRAMAFAIIGLHSYLSVYHGDSNLRNIRTIMAEKLYNFFIANSKEDWPWCEDIVAYANAKLAHALILAGQSIPNPDMFEMGVKVLKWLLDKQTSTEGHLSVIGNANWYVYGNNKSSFDQQPIEAMSLIDACVDLYNITKEIKWLKESEKCLGWFLGRNDHNITLYDFESGGCKDGLGSYGVNENQGAESTLAWLIALLKMYESMGSHNLV
ncbi:MAG: glycosyltransferase family 4 protein [Spirochaetota bacterium]|nr:glycosyltransferase family 4 protein [Spirochaetota bacterium]